VGTPILTGDPSLRDQLMELKEMLPEGTRLIAGGTGATDLKDDLDSRGIQCVQDIRQFQHLLKSI
jgi:hypothetical protein